MQIRELTMFPLKSITFGGVTWRSSGVKSDWLQVTLGRSVTCWVVLWTDVRRGALWVSGGMRWKPVTSCTTEPSLLCTPPKWSDWEAKQGLCYDEVFIFISIHIHKVQMRLLSKCMYVLILYSTLTQYYFLHCNLSTKLNWKIQMNFNIYFPFALMTAALELHEIHKFA